MGPCDPTELLTRLIKQLEKGREFARAGGQTIYDAMIVSKGTTLQAYTAMFNKETRYWICQTTDQNTWANYNIFFQQDHREHNKSVKNTGKGGCTSAVQNIYGVPPPLQKSILRR